MEQEKRAITSAEEFWALMSELLQKEELTTEDFDIRFEGWPVLFIKVNGEKFNSSLTGSMIAGMSSMNESFQRAYAMAKYGVPNLQKLTNDDKKSLDVVFKISEGSTESCTDWSCTANNALNVLQESMSGMEGSEKMVVLLALITALTLGGCYYLNRRSKDKETDALASANLLEANRQNTEVVVSGMRDAFSLGAELKQKGETPRSRDVEGFGENAKTSMLRSVANDADSAIVGGTIYTGAQLLDFKNRQSVKRDSKESIDDFFVQGLQRVGTTTDFNMLVMRQSTGESFNMKVSEEMTRPGEMDRLAAAVVTGEIFRISYLEVKENGVVARGQYNLIIDNAPPATASA
ncbi:hypothetical protein ACX1H4_13950 [Yersinia enterocolitica]|uniref:hypothetical protein n=1 Tax=Yersinia enterocolitica TaxID=630 RepID=UPI0028DAAB51|nr:hypothetical protein [Yersinia enterocolitica]EKN3597670.1 hypothetical protein [Yersinia enterocolitica]EKN4745002.1 hypothetical protein [Yersinia enterocolitica]EKN4836760.1 hypothetical protein [Yersinia enterocolitica]EKN6271013.1 hypothetical protein [Yersinia enterocolitica]